MTAAWTETDECDPPTDVRAIDAGEQTIAGTLHFQHLHGLLATLTPLRASYLGAAIDPLRALPPDVRRAILPSLLREHPTLLADPRFRSLADEVLPDTDAAADRPDVVRWLSRLCGVRAESAGDALDRAELALVALASSVAELARERADVVRALGARASEPTALEDAHAVLVWALGASRDQARAIDRAMAELPSQTASIASAASAAAASIEAPPQAASWWGRSVYATARWIESFATSEPPRQRFEAAFATHYRSRHDGGA